VAHLVQPNSLRHVEAIAGEAKYFRRPKNRPRRIFARNKFAAGDFISGENPPGGENNVAPLEIKSPPEQLEYRFNKSPNVYMQRS